MNVWKKAESEILGEELNGYRSSLRREDKGMFESLLKRPLIHVGTISNPKYDNWAYLLLSVIMEQERKIKTLEELYVDYRKSTKIPGIVAV